MKTVIIDGIRTPFGKWKGALSSLSATELGSQALASLLKRNPEASQADGVILAQVIQAGQGQNPARQVATKAGVHLSSPALTLNNVCLGGIASVADASRRLQLGEGELYIIGGFDSMTNAPHTTPVRTESGIGHTKLTDTLLHDGLWCSISDESMGALTDEQNETYNINRAAQDEYAALSQQRAANAQEQGLFTSEIAPIEGYLQEDEGIRAQTTKEKLANLSPVFSKEGTVTAGNASQMTDGASVGLIATEEKAKELGRSPLAEVIDWAEVAGPDTSLQTKPSKAIQKVLEKNHLQVSDIDLFEINEAFASVVVASCQDLDIDYSRVNVNGGAVAVGHPLGGTGFRLVLTLAQELKRRGGGKGVASLCGGGGQGMAVLIEVPTI